MPLPTIDPHRVRNAGETLLIAAIGAAVFVSINFPAGLICGSMVAVAVAAVAGSPMVVPTRLPQVTFLIIGISIGAVVTPRTLHGVVEWPVSMALISISALCVTVGTQTYLRLVHGWAAQSSLYGGSPGGMAQVISLATHSGADIRGVAIVQSTRVVFISVSIPLALAALGLAAPATATLGSATFDASFVELGVLVIFCLFTAWLLFLIRFPASFVFGAMLGSGILHGFGLVQATLPWW